MNIIDERLVKSMEAAWENLAKSVSVIKLLPDIELSQNNPPYGSVFVYESGTDKLLFTMTQSHNLFTVDDNGNPHMMPWAWRLLNWADDNVSVLCAGNKWHVPVKPNTQLPPAEAQAAWLDKILSLAIEAGMVKDG